MLNLAEDPEGAALARPQAFSWRTLPTSGAWARWRPWDRNLLVAYGPETQQAEFLLLRLRRRARDFGQVLALSEVEGDVRRTVSALTQFRLKVRQEARRQQVAEIAGRRMNMVWWHLSADDCAQVAASTELTARITDLLAGSAEERLYLCLVVRDAWRLPVDVIRAFGHTVLLGRDNVSLGLEHLAGSRQLGVYDPRRKVAGITIDSSDVVTMLQCADRQEAHWLVQQRADYAEVSRQFEAYLEKLDDGSGDEEDV